MLYWFHFDQSKQTQKIVLKIQLICYPDLPKFDLSPWVHFTKTLMPAYLSKVLLNKPEA